MGAILPFRATTIGEAYEHNSRTIHDAIVNVGAGDVSSLRKLKDEAEEAADEAAEAAEEATEEADEATEEAAEAAEEAAEALAGNKFIYAHGSLMITGWGLMLPSGVVIAALGKHRPGGIWFRVHLFLQISGLVVVLIAWIIAMTLFDDVDVVDDDYEDTHKTMGVVVMLLGLAQPLNALMRPHPPSSGEKKPLWRLLWEVVHKSLGYSAVVLALVTILLGTTLLPTAQVKRTFRFAYGIGVGGMLVSLILSLLLDKLRYRCEPGPADQESPPLSVDQGEKGQSSSTTAEQEEVPSHS